MSTVNATNVTLLVKSSDRLTYTVGYLCKCPYQFPSEGMENRRSSHRIRMGLGFSLFTGQYIQLFPEMFVSCTNCPCMYKGLKIRGIRRFLFQNYNNFRIPFSLSRSVSLCRLTKFPSLSLSAPTTVSFTICHYLSNKVPPAVSTLYVNTFTTLNTFITVVPRECCSHHSS